MSTKQKRHIITLGSDDYSILKNNSMIMTCCGSFLKKAKVKNHDVELYLTKYELNELTGFVAAEANHAESKRKEHQLSDVFDQLEIQLYALN